VYAAVPETGRALSAARFEPFDPVEPFEFDPVLVVVLVVELEVELVVVVVVTSGTSYVIVAVPGPPQAPSATVPFDPARLEPPPPPPPSVDAAGLPPPPPPP
jgi:hypothetical protein